MFASSSEPCDHGDDIERRIFLAPRVVDEVQVHVRRGVF